jgi:hypothetical protein
MGWRCINIASSPVYEKKKEGNSGRNQKMQVFEMENYVNVSFSQLNHSLCNSRTCGTKYTIYSNRDLNTEKWEKH